MRNYAELRSNNLIDLVRVFQPGPVVYIASKSRQLITKVTRWTRATENSAQWLDQKRYKKRIVFQCLNNSSVYTDNWVEGNRNRQRDHLNIHFVLRIILQL